MDLSQYIEAIKKKLNSSAVISSVEIIDERILLNRGYFRARLILSNKDFLEVAESFTIQADQCITLDYRYQWMNSSKQILRQRWDSVKHFPTLPNFPHHVHVGSDANVKPGQARSTIEFISFIESELS